MRHTIILSLTLAAFWLLNSAHNTPLLLSLGAASILLVLYIAHRMDVADNESQPVHLSLKFSGYYIWLFKALVLANISVVKHIWLGNKTISPTLTTIRASQVADDSRTSSSHFPCHVAAPRDIPTGGDNRGSGKRHCPCSHPSGRTFHNRSHSDSTSAWFAAATGFSLF